MLDELPERESFEQVDKIFQSLTNLNPRTCQRLLEACSNVKVKRLFLGSRSGTGIRGSPLVRDRIDLGKGKRLVRGGRLHPKYLITVPADLDGTSDRPTDAGALLVRVMPVVAGADCFALKGGTAINLFVRDLPRLSVDIDLTYLPVADRPTSLKA